MRKASSVVNKDSANSMTVTLHMTKHGPTDCLLLILQYFVRIVVNISLTEFFSVP